MTMDGPTANMKFLQEFSAKFMNENYHSLVDSGTCSRHIVHGAFGTVLENLDESLRSF